MTRGLKCLGVALFICAPLIVPNPAPASTASTLRKLERRITLVERQNRRLAQQLHAEQASRAHGDDDLFNGFYSFSAGCVQMMGVGSGFSNVTIDAANYMLFQAPSGGVWAEAYVPMIDPHCLGKP